MNKLFLSLLLAAGALVSCQNNKEYPVFFLTESGGNESGAGFNLYYNGKYYNRMPILSLKHCEKFRSFINPDGSYGVVIYLKDEFRNRLYTTTLQNQGRYMLPIVNGLAFEPTYIDRGITDGTLVIWNGLNGYDLKMLGQTLQPVEPEIEEKRYLDENPRPLPPRPDKNSKRIKDSAGRDIRQLSSGI